MSPPIFLRVFDLNSAPLPFISVLYMEFDNQDRIFKDYGGDTKGGKMHGEYGAKLRDHYQELLVADFEAPRRAEKLVHVVCFDVAEGKEGLWEDGAEILRKAGKGADGVLPVTLLHGGKLVGTWNRGLNRGAFEGRNWVSRHPRNTFSLS